MGTCRSITVGREPKITDIIGSHIRHGRDGIFRGSDCEASSEGVILCIAMILAFSVGWVSVFPVRCFVAFLVRTYHSVGFLVSASFPCSRMFYTPLERPSLCISSSVSFCYIIIYHKHQRHSVARISIVSVRKFSTKHRTVYFHRTIDFLPRHSNSAVWANAFTFGRQHG